MADEFPISSLAVGTFVLGLGWEDLPPASDPRLVFEHSLIDGRVALLVVENRLSVEIGRFCPGGIEGLDQWVTPILLRKELNAVISFGWSDAKISWFNINGEAVPRSSEVERYRIKERRVDGGKTELEQPSETTQKFEVESFDPARALDLRQRTGSMSLAFRQLAQHTIRLEARLSEIRSDTPEVIFDIASILRTLFCGKEKSGGRLIFKCAKEIGITPHCYTAFAPRGVDDFLIEGATYSAPIAVGFPTKYHQFENELESWLTETAIASIGVRIQHWKLIYDIAGDFGSHAGTDSSKVLFQLMDQSEASSDISFPSLMPKFRSYASLASEVSRVLIQRARVLDIARN